MIQDATLVYRPQHKIRILTAASLFDGHDAAINIMRRIMQAGGAEVIHLGHNRSAEEIVNAAIQEDVQALALTSYQGGHMEFFKYIYDLLQEAGCGHIKIFGGGGGTILPQEIEELQAYGITRIYSPDDGRSMGLQGMINDVLSRSDFSTLVNLNGESLHVSEKRPRDLARLITAIENETFDPQSLPVTTKIPVLGITGTGGAGKSSVVDEITRRFLQDFPEKNLAIVSVDPSKRKTGGALLGDRIRMNAIHHSGVFMRSLATRESNKSLSRYIGQVLTLFKSAGYDLIILESSGIGQSGSEIVDFADVSLYVMTPEYGAASQLEKIDMLDYADLVAINKYDKKGAFDALRDVRKQYKRNHGLWQAEDEALPIFGTIASQFNDPGVNTLYSALIQTLNAKVGMEWVSSLKLPVGESEKVYIIPPARVRYLSEIAQTVRAYNSWVKEQADIADRWYSLAKSKEILGESVGKELMEGLSQQAENEKNKLDRDNISLLENWDTQVQLYAVDTFSYKIRDKVIQTDLITRSLSNTRIPKVILPTYRSWGDILRWILQENVPGEYPFTAGVFPFKRSGEDPTRMFAGEGGPERTNKRFHYVSQGMPARRLSTAFDSVTLYGEDPDFRPDIYGKIGNSGVSVCCLDDAKKLYSGFNLCDPATSVSMTINGPAATVLAFFLNAAIDQQCELYIRREGLEASVREKIESIYTGNGWKRPSYEGDLPQGNDGLGLMLLGISGDQVLPAEVYQHIRSFTLNQVRGTVQADILKEDQAQNTCIFSTEFSLRLQGDVQQYFIDHVVRNFYSVSISGYHIAEAGANPITQLAFTLANGFTFLEYYRSRGMNVDDFAPNFSFFFSNGIDPEYAVIGRVARRIWAKALKIQYSANDRSQKLKYHIQTSGRSLHAQEIDFNDIRTTLQALYAIYDNCNSLHTNAYDEAITTPTEESVRRAIAIQMIINHELGLAKCENPMQGSFIIEELTDLVEEAVLMEFDRLTERGGVLGAMETMYQRNKIQEESLYYETLKHNGALPVVGVNTFLSSSGSPTILPKEVIRSTEAEKLRQIETLDLLRQRYASGESARYLSALQNAAIRNDNLFEMLMEAVKYCSLGQITHALFDVGGKYRRNM